MPFFKAVLFDWVGTLVVPKWGPVPGRPRGARWIESTLLRLGLDASAAAHREGYDAWVRAAGIAPALTRTAEERLHLVLGTCGIAGGGTASR